MTLDAIDRRIAKLRAHLRTPRGFRDNAARVKLASLLKQRDERDWYGRSYVTGLLKVIYPANSIYPTGVPIRSMPHPMFRLLRRA